MVSASKIPKYLVSFFSKISDVFPIAQFDSISFFTSSLFHYKHGTFLNPKFLQEGDVLVV